MTIQSTLRVVSFPGAQSYEQLWDLQRRLWRLRYEGKVADTLLLLEHDPVVTLGRNADRKHLLLDEGAFARRGVELIDVNRGGDVTYHGPGQLVGYLIFDLREWKQDVHLYLRQIEESIIQTLVQFGIPSDRSAGATGVWTGEKKIAAIGLHLSHWVSTHGFALNVTTDLDPFKWIVPCGLHGRGVTSMDSELPVAPERADVERRVVALTAELFDRRVEVWSADRLLADTVGLEAEATGFAQNDHERTSNREVARVMGASH